jgi:hypothetical protein
MSNRLVFSNAEFVSNCDRGYVDLNWSPATPYDKVSHYSMVLKDMIPKDPKDPKKGLVENKDVFKSDDHNFGTVTDHKFLLDVGTRVNNIVTRPYWRNTEDMVAWLWAHSNVSHKQNSIPIKMFFTVPMPEPDDVALSAYTATDADGPYLAFSWPDVPYEKPLKSRVVKVTDGANWVMEASYPEGAKMTQAAPKATLLPQQQNRNFKITLSSAKPRLAVRTTTTNVPLSDLKSTTNATLPPKAVKNIRPSVHRPQKYQSKQAVVRKPYERPKTTVPIAEIKTSECKVYLTVLPSSVQDARYAGKQVKLKFEVTSTYDKYNVKQEDPFKTTSAVVTLPALPERPVVSDTWNWDASSVKFSVKPPQRFGTPKMVNQTLQVQEIGTMPPRIIRLFPEETVVMTDFLSEITKDGVTYTMRMKNKESKEDPSFILVTTYTDPLLTTTVTGFLRRGRAIQVDLSRMTIENQVRLSWLMSSAEAKDITAAYLTVGDNESVQAAFSTPREGSVVQFSAFVDVSRVKRGSSVSFQSRLIFGSGLGSGSRTLYADGTFFLPDWELPIVEISGQECLLKEEPVQLRVSSDSELATMPTFRRYIIFDDGSTKEQFQLFPLDPAADKSKFSVVKTESLDTWTFALPWKKPMSTLNYTLHTNYNATTSSTVMDSIPILKPFDATVDQSKDSGKVRVSWSLPKQANMMIDDMKLWVGKAQSDARPEAQAQGEGEGGGESSITLAPSLDQNGLTYSADYDTSEATQIDSQLQSHSISVSVDGKTRVFDTIYRLLPRGPATLSASVLANAIVFEWMLNRESPSEPVQYMSPERLILSKIDSDFEVELPLSTTSSCIAWDFSLNGRAIEPGSYVLTAYDYTNGVERTTNAIVIRSPRFAASIDENGDWCITHDNSPENVEWLSPAGIVRTMETLVGLKLYTPETSSAQAFHELDPWALDELVTDPPLSLDGGVHTSTVSVPWPRIPGEVHTLILQYAYRTQFAKYYEHKNVAHSIIEPDPVAPSRTSLSVLHTMNAEATFGF